MRTFIAINLPPGVRAALHDALAPLRDRKLPVRWTQADSLHVTLKFIGEVEGSEIARLKDALRAAAARRSPMSLRAGGLGAFPSLRRANILWLGVEADGELMALQRDVELALSRLGYAREQRPFRPHITVGRLRSDSRPPDIERLAATVSHEAVFMADTVDLMRSHTGGGPAQYEALARQRLGEKVDA